MSGEDDVERKTGPAPLFPQEQQDKPQEELVFGLDEPGFLYMWNQPAGMRVVPPDWPKFRVPNELIPGLIEALIRHYATQKMLEGERRGAARGVSETIAGLAPHLPPEMRAQLLGRPS